MMTLAIPRIAHAGRGERCSPLEPSSIGDFALMERFWDKVKKTNDCWWWTAATQSNGYGEFGLPGRRTIVAHRFSWIIRNGPIPTGRFICHHCDNKLCVNPDHLFVGTHQDNVDDMVKKGRHRFLSGENNGMSKLDSKKVRRIRDFYEQGGLGQRCLAAMFGVSQFNVSLIVRGETW